MSNINESTLHQWYANLTGVLYYVLLLLSVFGIIIISGTKEQVEVKFWHQYQEPRAQNWGGVKSPVKQDQERFTSTKCVDSQCLVKIMMIFIHYCSTWALATLSSIGRCIAQTYPNSYRSHSDYQLKQRPKVLKVRQNSLEDEVLLWYFPCRNTTTTLWTHVNSTLNLKMTFYERFPLIL